MPLYTVDARRGGWEGGAASEGEVGSGSGQMAWGCGSRSDGLDVSRGVPEKEKRFEDYFAIYRCVVDARGVAEGTVEKGI